jgi:protein-S-isoprenylcysteine O-methyltransferase Ste14
VRPFGKPVAKAAGFFYFHRMLLFLKNLLFTVLVPGTVAVYVPLSLARGAGQAFAPAAPVALLLALPLLATGAAIYFWCLWDFAVTGRGTPAPIDAPKQLVRRGLYRYVRNPMYVGVLAVVAGWAVFFGSWRVAGYGAAVALGFHLFVVLVEEPMLRAQFGDGYTAYCREVGRWLPRRRRQAA